VSAMAIASLRNATVIDQLAGRHSRAATYRAIQLVSGYLVGVVAANWFATNWIAGFFAGLSGATILTALVEQHRSKINRRMSLDSSDFSSNAASHLPTALFGWLFGYGFPFLMTLLGRPNHEVAAFSVALAATFFCPMVLTSFYAAWAPRYAALYSQQQISRAKLQLLNSQVWTFPLLAIGCVGGLMTLYWQVICRAIGGGFEQYAASSELVGYIFLAYSLLSLHYIVAPIFLTHGTNAQFARFSIYGSAIGVVISTSILTHPQISIGIAYFAALGARGVLISAIARLRWLTPFPVAMLIFCCGLIGAGIAAMHIDWSWLAQ